MKRTHRISQQTQLSIAMTPSRYRLVAEQSPHFMTATINHWLPLLTRPHTVNSALDSWRYLQREAGFVWYGYVIMENHLHLIASSPDLSCGTRRFKSYTARAIVDYLRGCSSPKILDMLAFFRRPHKTESIHQIWEEGNHPQLIDHEATMRQNWIICIITPSGADMSTNRSIGDVPVPGTILARTA